jgi:6-phosphogluconolactonase
LAAGADRVEFRFSLSMTEQSTDYGRLIVGPKEQLFIKAAELAVEAYARSKAKAFTWAFTGGSTPQDWYRWAATTKALPENVLANAHFTVSDERHVPLASDQSNFGNAERLLLTPAGVPAAHWHPWAVDSAPEQAAEAYRRTMASVGGPGKGYDVCFLGMGDDAHTASFFPGSPLLQDDGNLPFAALEVPGKGWRLTITPAGLRACGLIVVMTLGAGKAEALKRVIRGPFDPMQAPAQILSTCSDRVVWLVDEAAAARL